MDSLPLRSSIFAFHSLLSMKHLFSAQDRSAQPLSLTVLHVNIKMKAVCRGAVGEVRLRGTETMELVRKKKAKD